MFVPKDFLIILAACSICLAMDSIAKRQLPLCKDTRKLLRTLVVGIILHL
jgi:hypothetical protein